jgi:arylformamidase
MQIHDVSISISPTMPTYPGDPKVSLDPVLQISKGDSANVSRLCMGDHTGTHVDPPVHFIPGGKTEDQLDLSVLYGPVRVFDMTHVAQAISAQDLEQIKLPDSPIRILFKTRNSWLWAAPGFQKDYVGIAWGGAQWLVDHQVALVGIDYLSVELFHADEPKTHRTLLGAGVIIVEGLNLRQIAPGDYTLACLPIKIAEGDGGPSRVVLIQD